MAISTEFTGACRIDEDSHRTTYGHRIGLFSRMDTRRNCRGMPDSPRHSESPYASWPQSSQAYHGTNGNRRDIICVLEPCISMVACDIVELHQFLNDGILTVSFDTFRYAGT